MFRGSSSSLERNGIHTRTSRAISVPYGTRPLASTNARWFALLIALIGTIILALFQQATGLFAAGAAQVQLTKTVSATLVESGEAFEYFLAYKCASITVDCEAPTITDVLPAEVDYVPDSATTTIHIQSVNYNAGTKTLQYIFKDPLPAGSTGIVTFQVRFPPGTLPGTTALNEATMTATNATPVTTAKVSTTATGQFEMEARKSGGPAVVGNPTNFSLEVCGPDKTGGVNFLSPVITDTLPADAIFVDAEGTQGVDWVYTPATPPNIGGTVRFISLPPILVESCLARRVTLQYDTIPAVQPVNGITASGIPEGCTNPSNLGPHCQGQTTRTLVNTHGFEVIAPFPSVAAGKGAICASSFDGSEALPGETVTYNIDVANNGYLTLQSLVVTDSIPSEIDLVAFTTGGAASRPITVSYQINSSGNWTGLAGSPYTTDATIPVASLGLNTGDIVTDLRWELGDLLVNSTGWRATITGTVNAEIIPEAPPQSFTNCANITSATLPQATQACSDVKIIAERAIPRIDKTGPTSAYLPLETADYAVTLTNAAVAHLALEKPVIADLLPAGFSYVAGSASFDSGSSAAGAPAPDFEAIENYNSTGRTLLRWKWEDADSTFDLLPGQQLRVEYQAQIAAGTPPGEYTNVAALVDWNGPADPDNPERDKTAILLCSGGDSYVDTLDLDGDQNTTEESCQDTQATRVAVSLAMESEKFVRGQIDCATYGTAACEDGDYNKLGLTVPGGPIDYRLAITNTSNVSVTNLVIIDILPQLNDTGVIDLSDRLSQWRPNLQAAVTGPSGIPLTILYSTQSNPCRPELGVSPAGCTPAGWSITPPDDITSVRAIKLDFCTYSGGQPTTDCLVLPRGGSFAFDWPMVAPNGAPADPSCGVPPQGALFDVATNPNCKIAWNSFGYTANEAKERDGQPGNDPDALQLLPAEPNKVGIRLMPGTNGLFAVGDLVWLDMCGVGRDGIQQPIEQTACGINGTRVELYDGQGSYLGYRITGPNNQGQPGYYLFAQLPAGNYQVRFCLPQGSNATLPNQGSDDTVDSDGAPSNYGGSCGAYSTEVFALNAGTVDANGADLTRDFGVWYEADFGDLPSPYPTQLGSSDAARHIIVQGVHLGATVDAELNGQPNSTATGDDIAATPDDEDGVQFMTPLVFGRPAQIRVTTSAAGCLSAFIDFNTDGTLDAVPVTNVTTIAGGGTATIPGSNLIGDLCVSAAGTYEFTIGVPATANGMVATRFRFTQSAGQGGNSATGLARTGEVEDYILNRLGDFVWFDNDGDGRQGSFSSEPGVPGVVVRLCEAATSQPVLVNGQPVTTTTDAEGFYFISGLPPGNYCVLFDLPTLPSSYGVTRQNIGDTTGDSDADPTTGRSNNTGPLQDGQENLTLDMGIATPDLRLVKTVDQPSSLPGALLVYTLAYSNTAFGAAREVFIEESVPQGTTYVAANSTAGWSCADGSGPGTTCRLSLGTLTYLQAGSALFAVRVDATLPGGLASIDNTAIIVSGTGELEPNRPNNQSGSRVPVLTPTALDATDEPEFANRMFLPSVQR